MRNLIANLRSTADSDVAFLICDNTNGADRDLQALASGFVTIAPRDQGRERMSQGHGDALTDGFSRVATEHCLVIDPDCRALVRGWDTRCRAALRDGCVAVGAPYPPWKLGKYHDYPGPHFAFFLTDAIRAAGADWRPYAERQGENVNDFFLRQLLLCARTVDRWALRRRARHSAIGARCEHWLGVVSKDTGWRVARNVRSKRWHAKIFDTLRSSADVEALTVSARHRAALARLAAEFELYAWNGTPMVAHCGRTTRLFDIYLWTGRPLFQVRRFWEQPHASVDDWERLCAAVAGVAA